jgi:thioredoxin-like negative regulator of GroEL
MAEMQKQMNQLITNFQANPANITSAYALASAYTQLQDSNAAVTVMDLLLRQSNVSPSAVVEAALFAQRVRNVPLMERALMRLTEVNPESPEAWYDLAAMQASLGKADAAMPSLRRAIQLSDRRLLDNPGAPGTKDLRQEVAREERFAPLRSRPDWETVLQRTSP